MALVKYGPLAQEVAGTVGGVTFSRVASGKSCRGWRAPVDKRTPSQLAHRTNLAKVSALWWSYLNLEQRQDWDDYAPSCTFTNSLGENYTLNGFNMFLRNLTIQRTYLLGPVYTAPTLQGFGQTYTFDLSLSHSSGVLAITNSHPDYPESICILYEIHSLRRVTQVFPVPQVLFRESYYFDSGFPRTIYTYPHPLPATAGSIAALIRFYMRDFNYRTTKPQWALIASS